LGQVGLATYESGKFPHHPHHNFSIFSFRVKKYPGQGRVGPLFTAGQKYPWVGLGQGPSLEYTKQYVNISQRFSKYDFKK